MVLSSKRLLIQEVKKLQVHEGAFRGGIDESLFQMSIMSEANLGHVMLKLKIADIKFE